MERGFLRLAVSAFLMLFFLIGSPLHHFRRWQAFRHSKREEWRRTLERTRAQG